MVELSDKGLTLGCHTQNCRGGNTVPPRQSLQSHLRPQAGEAPQSFVVPHSGGETVLSVIKPREIDAERDFWILPQKVVDFTYAAVVSLVTRRVIWTEDDAADVSIGICNCIQITTHPKQHRFGMVASVSTVCSTAFLDYAAWETPQFIEEEVFVSESCCWSVWEAKDPVKFCVRDSCFFTSPYVVGTLSADVVLSLTAIGLYHSPLICQIFLENRFLSWIHVLLKNLPVCVLHSWQSWMKKGSNILSQPFDFFCTWTAKIVGDSLFKNVLKLVAAYRNLGTHRTKLSCSLGTFLLFTN